MSGSVVFSSVCEKKSAKEMSNASHIYIEEILDEEDISDYDIVIAWGNSMTTHAKTINAKIDLLNMMKERKLDAQVKCIVTDNLVTEKIYGVHPLFLGLHYAKDEWKLMEYPVGEIVQELENSLVKKPPEEPKKKGRKKNTTKNQE